MPERFRTWLAAILPIVAACLAAIMILTAITVTLSWGRP